VAGADWDFTKYVEGPSQQRPTSDQPGPPAHSADFAPGSTTADFTFGQPGLAGGTSADLSVQNPPARWLALALAAVVLGGAAALVLGEAPSWAIAAWALSGPVAIGLLAAFTRFDTRARTAAVYAQRGWVQPLYVVCLVLSGVAVCLSALRIASWVGRL
jgi:hypothetical protein